MYDEIEAIKAHHLALHSSDFAIQLGPPLGAGGCDSGDMHTISHNKNEWHCVYQPLPRHFSLIPVFCCYLEGPI